MEPIEANRQLDMQKIGSHAIALASLLKPGETIAVNLPPSNIILPGHREATNSGIIVITRPDPFTHIQTGLKNVEENHA